MTNIVDVQGLSRQFGPTTALDAVNFSATQGRVHGLVGMNGAGKTTLIKHLLGLLRPTRGSVRVFGLDPVRDPVGVLRRVGYLSEYRELPEWMRIDELLRYTQAYYPSWDVAYARELLDTFGLDGKRKVAGLSQGMRAQTGLVVAVAHRPDLLILDEPSSGLDAVVRQDILDAIVRTVADDGRTVIFSSHLLDEVERMSDHVTMIHDGKVVLNGSVEDIRGAHSGDRAHVRTAPRPIAEARRHADRVRRRAHLERRARDIARGVAKRGGAARRRGSGVAQRDARGDLRRARRARNAARGGGVSIWSPVTAMLWESWRLTWRQLAFSARSRASAAGQCLPAARTTAPVQAVPTWCS